MQTVDIVIISDSKNKELIEITNKMLDSLYSSESNISFNVFIVESQPNILYNHSKLNIKMIYPNSVFGYHKYLNIGRKLGNSEYVVLCNNDLIFETNWISNAINIMKSNNILSASPYDTIHKNIFKINKNTGEYYGYQTRKYVTGWCIIQNRKIYDIIGDLDEQFIFWCCDDDYAMTLKTNNIKHSLITNSIVYHKESKTLNTIDTENKMKLTMYQYKVFENKWNISTKDIH